MEVAAGRDHQQLVTIKVVEALGRSGSPRRDLVPRHRAWLVTDPPAALLEAQAVIHLPVVDEEAGIESTHLAEGAAGEEPAAADHVVAVDRLRGDRPPRAGAPRRPPSRRRGGGGPADQRQPAAARPPRPVAPP